MTTQSTHSLSDADRELSKWGDIGTLLAAIAGIIGVWTCFASVHLGAPVVILLFALWLSGIGVQIWAASQMSSRYSV
jgi:hypothetical protein